ncbi:MAG: BrnT family toxin [Moraxella sp.]|nr:BrnT family toxin [Moraxella sp.]
MDIHHYLNGVCFVWDNQKDLSNLSKHGIDFKTACTAFFDPFFITQNASDNYEYRMAIIGYDEHAQLLFVVHLETQHEQIRLISARVASKQERLRYECT